MLECFLVFALFILSYYFMLLWMLVGILHFHMLRSYVYFNIRYVYLLIFCMIAISYHHMISLYDIII